MHNISKYLIKSVGPLIFFYVVALLLLASGRIARWDLLEQIAMADNFISNGIFYPDKDSLKLHGVSVYFPGVSLLALLIRLIGINSYIVEVMLIFAVFIFIIFILILVKLTKSINSGTNFYKKDLFVLFLSFLFFVTPNYIIYAVEFKPDTISLVLGYGGLIMLSSNRGVFFRFVIPVISISIAIIFKQHFVAFVIGLFLSIFFIKKNDHTYVSTIVIIFCVLILLFFSSQSNLWFWNVQVLLDDGFEKVSFLFRELVLVFTRIICFIILIFLSTNKLESFNLQINFELFRNYIYKNPLFMITPFVILAAGLSFVKNGGNASNIELAIAICIPLFSYTFNFISRDKIILISWIGLLFTMPNYFDSIGKYLKAIELKRQVELLDKNDLNQVLTGSDVYYATRVLNKPNRVIENYWTQSLKLNNQPHEQLSILLNTKNYSLIVVENLQSNYEAILHSNKYKIIYQNKLGIIAKLNK